MTDEELLSSFEEGTIEGGDFPHEAHLRVAWLLAQRHDGDEAYRRVADGIRGIARRAGRPDVFHETVTRAWFELVAGVEELAAHPELRDRGLLNRYYSAEALAAGRSEWIEPDLRPLEL